MTDMMETPRLTLRRWSDADRDAFATLNADTQVMQYFKSPLTRIESDAFMDRINAHFSDHDFGFWAVEDKSSRAVIGMTGLARVTFNAPFAPCVEIGWRFVPSVWGQGFAPEAARAALAFGFHHLRLSQVVAFTTVNNAPSRRVMEKLGMTYDAGDDFTHPNLPEDHALRPHVLYRLNNPRAGAESI